MVARPILAIVSLILLAGGTLLQLLIVLSGGINSSPVNQIYFLQSTTDGIEDARNPTRWTYFALCGVNDNGNNANCGSPVPALPFDPPHRNNFGTTQGVPDDFVDTSYYYYMSRFPWVFLLISLLFAAIGLTTGLLAMCTKIGAYLSGMVVIVALFFQTLAAALYTVWIVKGRNAFNRDGQDAKIGPMALAFLWTSMCCFFLSTILFCIGGAVSGRNKGNKNNRFGRSKSKRSRGSFDS